MKIACHVCGLTTVAASTFATADPISFKLGIILPYKGTTTIRAIAPMT